MLRFSLQKPTSSGNMKTLLYVVCVLCTANTVTADTEDVTHAGGLVYTRWGRTTCPLTSGTQLVYHGRAAGSHSGNKGSGIVCQIIWYMAKRYKDIVACMKLNTGLIPGSRWAVFINRTCLVQCALGLRESFSWYRPKKAALDNGVWSITDT